MSLKAFYLLVQTKLLITLGVFGGAWLGLTVAGYIKLYSDIELDPLARATFLNESFAREFQLF